ncbi:MAG: hypothetical protein KC496_07855 [Anaerolineae bacterium]|nr:hypothetical protein [Anaerolineae bacterium]
MLKQAVLIFSLLLLMITACTPAAEESTPIPTDEATEAVEVQAATQTPTTPATATTQATEIINEPTSTPMPVLAQPAMELLSGAVDSCVNAEDYGRVIGFDVRYQDITTEHFVVIRLLDSEGNVLAEDGAHPENHDEEAAYGFYPRAYEVPENSEITAEVTVYLSDADDAPASSYSLIVFDCTTGEVFSSNFQQYEL